MSRFMKTILLLSLFFLAGIYAQSQIKFYEGDFKTPITNLKELDLHYEKCYGITIPLDAEFKKYDKIGIYMVYCVREDYEDSTGNYDKNAWHEVNAANEYVYKPKSETFKDNYGTQKFLKLYLVKNEAFTDYNHLFYGGWFREYFHKYKFKIIVAGHFADGTYSEYDSYSGRLENKTRYSFSKNLYESNDFTFRADEAFIQEQKDKRLAEKKQNYTNTLGRIVSDLKDYENLDAGDYHEKNLWEDIYRSLEFASEYTYIDSVGYYAYMDRDGLKSRYYSLRTSYAPFSVKSVAWIKYIIVRNYLLDNYRFDDLKAIEEKLIQIKKDKRQKDLYVKLEGQEEPEKIMEIIQGY